MKQIQNYDAPKYQGAAYSSAADGIYRTQEDGESRYVTSLSFVQEPELGEGENAGDISEYPLEDLLDEFGCYISDFYEDLNTEHSRQCYLEFAGDELEDVEKLRTIIGKHVCNKEAGGYEQLIIE